MVEKSYKTELMIDKYVYLPQKFEKLILDKYCGCEIGIFSRC